MIQLKPLLVITGTAHREGRGNATDNGAANVITTGYMRSVRKLAVLRTPFGLLADPARRPEILELCSAVSRKIRDYHLTKRSCRLTNCVLVERLRGQREQAVAGWIEARLDENDADVLAAREHVVQA